MSAATTPAGTKSNKGKILALVGLIFLAGLGYFGINWYLDQHNYVTTENAKISGDIFNVSSKIPGKVAEVKVSTGSQVKKGDVLFSLEPDQLQAQLDQAQAALDIAKAQLTKAAGGARSQEVSATQSAVDQAQAGYTGALSGRDSLNNTLHDLQQKYDSLIAQMSGFKNPSTGLLDANYALSQLDQALAAKAVTDAQYTVKAQAIQSLFTSKAQLEAQIEQIQGQLKTLDAQVSAAKAGLNGAKSRLSLVAAGASDKDIAIIEAQVRAAQATYDLAKLNFNNGQVTAPADGTVVQLTIHPGDAVVPGQAAVSLVDFSKLQVTAYVLENDLERVLPGQTVKFSADAFPGLTFSGTVKEVGLATASVFNLFSTENASGNFTKVSQRIPVKIDFDSAGKRVIPGMSVTVKIKVTQ